MTVTNAVWRVVMYFFEWLDLKSAFVFLFGRTARFGDKSCSDDLPRLKVKALPGKKSGGTISTRDSKTGKTVEWHDTTTDFINRPMDYLCGSLHQKTWFSAHSRRLWPRSRLPSGVGSHPMMNYGMASCYLSIFFEYADKIDQVEFF